MNSRGSQTNFKWAKAVVVGVLIQSTCFAEVTKLPTQNRRVLADSSRFRQVLAVTALPPAIFSLCADENCRLAGPRQKWEATDAITDLSLPRKRLVWAAVSGEYYVVHYERGGRAHSFHVLVATLAPGETQPKIVWRGVGYRLTDYPAFLRALQNGKLDDRLDYAH